MKNIERTNVFMVGYRYKDGEDGNYMGAEHETLEDAINHINTLINEYGYTDKTFYIHNIATETITEEISYPVAL